MEKDKRFNVDFIGIGAAKSGTSWIAQCLREHPEICIPQIKEICFFNKGIENNKQQCWYYLKGIEWYKNQFSECNENRLKGEFSVDYIYDSDVPELIKKHFSNVKLIACLRNPIDRAYSHYWWNTVSLNKDHGGDFFKIILKDKEYIERSLYFKYLQDYYKLFSKDSIYIILHDDIIAQPKKVIKDLYKFLNVSHHFVPPSLNKRVNPAREAKFKFLIKLSQIPIVLEKLRLGFLVDFFKKWGIYHKMQILYMKINIKKLSYPLMGKNTRNKLKKYFKEDIEKLEKLIDKDLSAWK